MVYVVLHRFEVELLCGWWGSCGVLLSLGFHQTSRLPSPGPRCRYYAKGRIRPCGSDLRRGGLHLLEPPQRGQQHFQHGEGKHDEDERPSTYSPSLLFQLQTEWMDTEYLRVADRRYLSRWSEEIMEKVS